MDKLHQHKICLRQIFARNFLTGTQVVIPIVNTVVVHVELTVVPIAVGHNAIRIARAVFLSNFFRITESLLQNFLSFPVVKRA
jgi:hypothetical protein